MFICSYGKGDFVLAKVLKFISGGHWNFVWAQQYFSITDQLNMGVRYFMLDPVYFWGAMRLCHCGGAQSQWMDTVLYYLQKVMNLIHTLICTFPHSSKKNFLQVVYRPKGYPTLIGHFSKLGGHNITESMILMF